MGFQLTTSYSDRIKTIHDETNKNEIMRQHFRLFNVSNLSALNIRIFLLNISGATNHIFAATITCNC